MEAFRTVPVTLDVPADRRDDLHATAEQFLHCANRASEWAWSNTHYEECCTNKGAAERALYDPLREETDLHANLVQKAIRRAVEAVKSGVSKWKGGRRTNQPEFEAWSVVYDERSATFRENGVCLSTVNGRVECEYVLPDGEDNPHHEYLLDDEWTVRNGVLQYDDATDTFELHVRCHRHIASGTDTPEHETVLGVDLNVDGYVAVTSTGRFIESADHVNHVREQYERRRGSLQQTGTQSARRTLARIGTRFSRWAEDLLHRIANAIIEEAVAHECATIAVEELTHIRDRMGRGKRFQQWMFWRLREYVEYKAAAEGIDVVDINPEYTSQRCSKCGTTLEENRDGDDFACLKCGYEVHADYNAAKNVGLKYVRHGQTSRGGRAPRQCALKSGTVTANGDPAPASSEA